MNGEALVDDCPPRNKNKKDIGKAFQLIDIELPETMCAKCLRISTHNYPLDITSVSVNQINHCKFGSNLRSFKDVYPCSLRVEFTTGVESNTWRCAWPSVISSFISATSQDDEAELVFSLLPSTLSRSCYHQNGLNSRVKELITSGTFSPRLTDITQRRTFF